MGATATATAGVRQVLRWLPVPALSLLPVIAAAAVPGVPAPAHEVVEPLAMGNLVQLTLGLLAVLLVIVGVAWVMRRVGRIQAGPGGAMRVLGGLSMGARERVVLVQVGETQLLLGIAPGRVQTLHVLEQPLPSGSAAAPGAGGFADKLRAALDKRSGQ